MNATPKMLVAKALARHFLYNLPTAAQPQALSQPNEN
jgi:hypothetical protein